MVKYVTQQKSIKQRLSKYISTYLSQYSQKIGLFNHFLNFINKSIIELVIKIQEFWRKYSKNNQLKLEQNYKKATKEMLNLQVQYSKSKNKKLQKLSSLISDISSNEMKNEILKFFLMQTKEFKKALRKQKESRSKNIMIKNDIKRQSITKLKDDLEPEYKIDRKMKSPIMFKFIPQSKIQKIIENLLINLEQSNKLK